MVSFAVVGAAVGGWCLVIVAGVKVVALLLLLPWLIAVVVVDTGDVESAAVAIAAAVNVDGVPGASLGCCRRCP